jgi:hypothetical protein
MTSTPLDDPNVTAAAQWAFNNVVLPLSAKVGEGLIERVADGIDDQLVDLLKKAASARGSRDKQATTKAVDRYLSENVSAADKLAANVSSLLDSTAAANALAATMLPATDSKLVYYQTILNWISGVAAKLDRDIVVKGFLTGPGHLAYFVLADTPAETPWQIDRFGSRSQLWAGGDFKLYVEKVPSTELRDAKFSKVNEKIRLSSPTRFRGSNAEVRPLRHVEAIYDDWITYKGTRADLLANSSSMQRELRIDQSYDALSTMVASVAELAKTEGQDTAALRNALRRALAQVMPAAVLGQEPSAEVRPRGSARQRASA